MVLYFDVILAYRNERGTFAEAARIVVDAILSLRKKKSGGIHPGRLTHGTSKSPIWKGK